MIEQATWYVETKQDTADEWFGQIVTESGKLEEVLRGFINRNDAGLKVTRVDPR